MQTFLIYFIKGGLFRDFEKTDLDLRGKTGNRWRQIAFLHAIRKTPR
jgi:hypothetical protein